MPITRHCEFGPHGDGTHGLPSSFCTGTKVVFWFSCAKKIIQKICERLNKGNKRLGYRFTHCTHTHTTIVHRPNSLQYFSFFRAMNNRSSPNPKIHNAFNQFTNSNTIESIAVKGLVQFEDAYILHSSRLHRTNGSPVKPRVQLQMGL